MNGITDEFTDLLGAYALDGVEPLERKRIERHVASCDACAAELRNLQEAAAELSAGREIPLPDGFADRIVASVEHTNPGRLRRIVATVAAAAAVFAAVAGGFYFEATQHSRDINHLVATGRPLALRATGGFPGRGTMYLGKDRAAVVLRDVPDAGSAHTYQLWAIKGGTPTSVAVLDEHGDVRTIVRAHDRDAVYAVTVEPDGGSKRPTTEPVLSTG